MKFSFEVGEQEKHHVDFWWGQVFGRLRIRVDGSLIVAENTPFIEKSGFDFSSKYWSVLIPDPYVRYWFAVIPIPYIRYLWVKIWLVRTWTFDVGIAEQHLVRIEKERAKHFAGLRPMKYRAYVDNQLLFERHGY